MLVRVLIVVGAVLSSGVALAQNEVVPTPTPAIEVGQVQSAVYHSGWGALQSDGSLRGQVVTVGSAAAVNPQGNATVTLSQDLVVIATTRTAADGSFELSGLSPGVYEIAAESPGCYGIVSFQAVASDQLGLAPVMEVYASTMQRTDVDGVLQSLWSPQDAMVSGGRPFEGLVSPLRPATQSQQVAIRGGAVSGQVAFANPRNIPEAHVVKVFSQGKLIATAPVDRYGKFSFPAQTPGPVDLVLGGSAYAAVGVELVDDAARLSAVQPGDVRFVSNNAAVASQLLIPAAGGPPADGIGQPLPIGEPLPLAGPAYPMGGGFAPGGGGMGGGGGGFGGGGGGMGGGMGGIGGLLGIAGLAVGVTALANNNDGFTTPVGTPVVVTP